MNPIQYIIVASIILSIFYIVYRVLFQNVANFNQLRIYLLVSILVSVVVPLLNISVNIDLFSAPKTQIPLPFHKLTTTANIPSISAPVEQSIDWNQIIKSIYYVISTILIIRILLVTLALVIRFYKSERMKLGNYTLISTNKQNTFSFFHWIFINKQNSTNEEFEQIVLHEKIHASQYHSIDVILIELLAAVMWFNPLVWMMKKSIQLVHEYLADEGALSTGIDRLRYQALLVNQSAEERLICLSSSFNHSLIKKRMIMMTKSKFNQKSKLRILTLVPITAFALLFTAGVNGLYAKPTKTIASNLETLPVSPITTSADTIKVNKAILTTSKSNEKSSTITVESPTVVYISNEDGNDSTKSTSEKTIHLKTNGMLVIQENNRDSIIIVVNEQPEKPSNVLYIVDGVEQPDNKALDKLDAKTIVAVELYKGEKMIKYTTKKYDGVMVIKTKENLNSSNILYIIDGKEHSNKRFLDEIDPNSIDSINVIKGEQIKHYTSGNYNGVILVTTKRDKK